MKSKPDELLNHFYLSEEERERTYNTLTRNWISTEELGVKEVERGIILPCARNLTSYTANAGGVCTENFEFVAGHLQRKPREGENVSSVPLVSRSYVVPRDEMEFINETVVFGGVMRDHSGHMILDGIANRMWWHIKNPESKLKFAFIVIWGNGDLFVREFIKLLGVPEERILFITKPTQFAKVIVPDQSLYWLDSFHKEEYKSVIECIKNHVAIDPPKKLFLTYNSRDNMVNQEYFENFYKEKGFEIIVPEDYTLPEKLSMMRGAKEVASLGMTNLMYTIFCEPDTKVFFLGRSVNPLGEGYLHYLMSDIDMYVIECSLAFFHRDRVMAVHFVGATKYWAQFVKDYYHEQIEETEESVLKEFSYAYMKKCAEAYPMRMSFYSSFARSTHFQIIDSMNRILLGRKLDPSEYKYKEPLDIVRRDKQAFADVMNFCIELNLDFMGERKFERFTQGLAGKKIAVLKFQDRAGQIFLKACENAGAKVVFKSAKAALNQLSGEEFEECKKADVVVTCCVHGTKTHGREGVKCIDIWDVLRDGSLTKDLPAAQPADVSADTFAEEIKALRDDLYAQNTRLSERIIAEYHSGLAQTDALNRRIKELDLEKDRLNSELGRMSCENELLRKNIKELESGLSGFGEENKTLSAQNEKLSSGLSEASEKLSSAEKRIGLLEEEKEELGKELTRVSADGQRAGDALAEAREEAERLKNTVYEMENSRSWRYTKIFRKNKKDEG